MHLQKGLGFRVATARMFSIASGGLSSGKFLCGLSFLLILEATVLVLSVWIRILSCYCCYHNYP